jgi:hypothetical protein
MYGTPGQIASESGALYYLPGLDFPDHYMTGTAGSNGRLEVETGSSYMPWLPLRTCRYAGDRFWVVQWWAVVLVEAAGLRWFWRRRRSRRVGFPVVTGDQRQ